jgi:hypothetical protein
MSLPRVDISCRHPELVEGPDTLFFPHGRASFEKSTLVGTDDSYLVLRQAQDHRLVKIKGGRF